MFAACASRVVPLRRHQTAALYRCRWPRNSAARKVGVDGRPADSPAGGVFGRDNDRKCPRSTEGAAMRPASSTRRPDDPWGGGRPWRPARRLEPWCSMQVAKTEGVWGLGGPARRESTVQGNRAKSSSTYSMELGVAGRHAPTAGRADGFRAADGSARHHGGRRGCAQLATPRRNSVEASARTGPHQPGQGTCDRGAAAQYGMPAASGASTAAHRGTDFARRCSAPGSVGSAACAKGCGG